MRDTLFVTILAQLLKCEETDEFDMTDTSSWKPPRVWRQNQENSGRWSGINRPVAGPTYERKLPRGQHPMQLYSLGTPNGIKVTVMLEELLEAGYQGAEYDAWYIDIEEGEQFGSDFVAINPNSKIPALLDCSGEEPVRIFESGAILWYLADKFQALAPTDARGKAECLSWLFWQMGSAPYLGGGFGHFYRYAPWPMEYPIHRYTMEVKRQLDVLDRNLAERRYICGDEYTVADIAIWPWYGRLALNSVYEAAEFLDTASYRHVNRWTGEVAARPAVARGRRVNRSSDKPGLLCERHDARDFGDP